MSDETWYEQIAPLPDTQPQKGNRTSPGRTYVPATWAPRGGGSGHPKLSGGYEVDIHGAVLPTRGLNRADQLYEQPMSTINANRAARAVAESASTVVLDGAAGEIEVRGPSGNNYDVILSPFHQCDCPDYLKLRASYVPIVDCKHIRIALIQIANAGPLGLYKSCAWISGQSGFSIRAVQEVFNKGLYPATKINGVWVIDPVTAGAVVLYLQSKLTG